MKLAIGGATGFVGLETLRQALQSPEVHSVLAVTRRPVAVPDGYDGSKLESLILDDFMHYPEDAQKQLATVDGFIWTVAVTPSKSKSYEWEDIRKTCHDYAMTALKSAVALRSPSRPLRFVLYSGWGAERDQTKTPPWLPKYCLMRGQVETEALQYAAESKGVVDVCCAKPGFITGPNRPLSTEAKLSGLPHMTVEACSAATLKQCINGIEQDTLTHDDLVRIGKAYLAHMGLSESKM